MKQVEGLPAGRELINSANSGWQLTDPGSQENDSHGSSHAVLAGKTMSDLDLMQQRRVALTRRWMSLMMIIGVTKKIESKNNPRDHDIQLQS